MKEDCNDRILDLISDLAFGKLSARAEQCDGVDDQVNAIIEGLNMLAEELESTLISKRLLKGIFESMGEALLVMDSSGLVQKANPAACELFGYTEHEFQGLPIVKISKKVALLLQRRVEDPSRSQIVRGLEDEFISKTEEPVPVLFSFSMLLDKYEIPDIFVCTARDIYRLKEAEKELRLAKRHLTNAQHLSRTGSWRHELKYNRLDWSDEVYRILGYKDNLAQPSFEKFMEHIHPDDRGSFKEYLARSAKSKEPFEFDHQMVQLDGQAVQVHSRVSFFFDEKGDIVYAEGTLRDLSEFENKDFVSV